VLNIDRHSFLSSWVVKFIKLTGVFRAETVYILFNLFHLMVYMYSAMLFRKLNDMTAYSTCYNIVVSRNSLSHAGSRLHPLEIKSERKREQICSLIFFIFFSTHCFYPRHFILVFFVCRCYLTRSAILVSSLCIRPSTSVLYRSSHSRSLLLFAGCGFCFE
jgi:hypothetical protein